MSDATGSREELATDGLGDEWTLDLETEGRDPTHQVVGDRCEHGPGPIRVEVARRAVLEPRTLLQVTDRQLHDDVTT